MSENARLVRVLAVDDSAVMREVVAHLLTRARGFATTVAADPIIAAEKMRRERPDVVLLDLELPRMDGLTFLRRLMAEDPLPVVVFSSLTAPGTELAMEALDAGAVDVIEKPRVGVRAALLRSGDVLAQAMRAAAGARVWRRAQRQERREPAEPRPGPVPSGIRLTTDKVIALGASTGGTEALRHILGALPPDVPGLVVVQHMPEGFTAAFARRLNADCALEVKEAETGDRILSGRALIARGNHHLRVVRSGAHYAVELSREPAGTRHRPSVDELFRSVAGAAGPNAAAALLTGMGDDGAEGLLELRRAGAHTLAQDEATSVVFGMPKEAIRRGAAVHVLPLGMVAGALAAWARR